MDNPLLILTSVGSEQQAITIAEELIQQELVACVNILPAMRSIYRFKGKIYDDEENLLLIKTTESLFDEVAAVISQMHTYEVPEITGIPIEHCMEEFAGWVNQNVLKRLLEKGEKKVE